MNDPRATRVFWGRILTVVDDIDDPSATLCDLKAHLLAVDEGFSQTFDPADQYAEYLTVLLCRAVRRKIDGDDQAIAAPPGAGCTRPSR